MVAAGLFSLSSYSPLFFGGAIFDQAYLALVVIAAVMNVEAVHLIS